ncbi:MAG: putative DNA binding domain-containing protein [Bacilli bacterium]|nr:putative DNA binding domain-containing protein [Bacilli bacterium]
MYKENELIELKKSLTQLKEGIISMSSMLNKNGKATVYFGINDDGKVCGLTVGKKTKSEIANEINNNLKPLPLNVLINDSEVDGKTIIMVQVDGNDTPYSAYGRYYIRLDDSDIQMQQQELQHFFERKEENYSSWEKEATSLTLDDINEELLIDCIRTANEKGRLNYVYRNSFEALSKLGLLSDDGHINKAGEFLFGNNKPLKIKEANFPTDSRTDFGEIKEFRGNIIECIKEAISYLQNHISYKSNIIGIQREEVPEIPLLAIREIVINSFAHCSYARTGDFITFTIFKSQIKIYNPGSIFNGIDPVKFASGSVGSKIRNLLIAQTLFYYGFIDAFGTGFDRTFTICANNGVEYKYNNDEMGFTFAFKRKPDFLNDKINDKINYKIDSIDKSIIENVLENKYITIPELALLIKKSEPTIHRHLDHLFKLKMIKRVGSRKNGYWEVLK